MEIFKYGDLDNLVTNNNVIDFIYKWNWKDFKISMRKIEDSKKTYGIIYENPSKKLFWKKLYKNV